MMTINYTSQFKKELRTALKRGCDRQLFEFVVGELANGRTLDAKYRDHTLTGNFKGFRECHLQPDWLLIYLVEQDILTLTLSRTGSHSDLFGKNRR